jgi:hypothetical protein
MLKLKPCPFCGEKDDVCYNDRCVFCEACFASGPVIIGNRSDAQTKDLAIAEWNERPFEAARRPEEE